MHIVALYCYIIHIFNDILYIYTHLWNIYSSFSTSRGFKNIVYYS